MGYYVDIQGNYHTGDMLPGDTVVPQRPSPYYTWQNGAWVGNLQQAQQAKIIAIQVAWAQLEQGGLSYMGKIIPTDPVSGERIAFAVLNATANPNFTTTWLCADGTTITMNATQIIGMGTALAAFDGPLSQHCDGLISQVNAATTVDQINAIPNW